MKKRKKLAWLTAPRLDSLSTIQMLQLCGKITDSQAASILITGDVSSGTKIVDDLQTVYMYTNKPIYYVMGASDYKKKNISEAREEMSKIENKDIVWLQDKKLIKINRTTALVGIDGWGDVTLGAGKKTKFILGAHKSINDFKLLENDEMLNRLHDLAVNDVNSAEKLIEDALQKHRHVVFATNIPPYIENTISNDRAPNDHMLPFCVCKAMGDMLTGLMKKYSQKKLTITSGLVHTDTEFFPIENIRSLTNKKLNLSKGALNFFEV